MRLDTVRIIIQGSDSAPAGRICAFKLCHNSPSPLSKVRNCSIDARCVSITKRKKAESEAQIDSLANSEEK